MVDAAQLVPHRRTDIERLGVDYVALSGHKRYVPYGAGVLAGRVDWLDAAPPYLLAGGAVHDVSLDGVSCARRHRRHEGGTPNLLGAVALAAACDALAGLPAGALEAYEEGLGTRLAGGLDALPGVDMLRMWPDCPGAIGVVGFAVDGGPAEVISEHLAAAHGIGVRDGASARTRCCAGSAAPPARCGRAWARARRPTTSSGCSRAWRSWPASGRRLPWQPVLSGVRGLEQLRHRAADDDLAPERHPALEAEVPELLADEPERMVV